MVKKVDIISWAVGLIVLIVTIVYAVLPEVNNASATLSGPQAALMSIVGLLLIVNILRYASGRL